VITKFIVPLFTNVLEYSISDIEIKPQLTINYGRKVERLGGESDVVIKKNDAPVIVIEAKSYGHPLKSGNEDAEGQAFDYTRANELKPTPKYYMTTNVTETHIYKTESREEIDISPIPENELLESLSIISGLLNKKHIITLGRDIFTTPLIRKKIEAKREFERVLFKCQDLMREASESKTGLIAFAEMNKLLFIKLYEDRRERKGQENRFTLKKIKEEGDNYIKGTLYKDIKDYYSGLNVNIFEKDDKINLDDVTINKIVDSLEKYYLVDEDSVVYPPVAYIYENFVSTIFRGENGQYFTPRNIVDFIVNIFQLEWGSEGKHIVDPCCGSGGFLLSAFNALNGDLKSKYTKSDGEEKQIFINSDSEKEYLKLKDYLCKELLVGFDNEEIIAKTAAMNMSVHGDGSTGINTGDSLKIEKYKEILKENYFDYALTNPPFSSQVKPDTHIDSDGKDVLEKYELSHSHSYNEDKDKFDYTFLNKDIRQQDSKVLFIERCYKLLKPRGYLGIIVDDGVLNNKRDAYIRDYIYRKFIIHGIIALPFDIFKEQDAHNYTSILLLQKKDEGMVQDDVFMAITEHCGEAVGKSTKMADNDLDDVYDDFIKYKKEDKKDFTKFSFIVKYKELLNQYEESSSTYHNRLDPKFYSPRKVEIVNKIKNTGTSKKIKAVVDFVEEIAEQDSLFDFGTKYIEKISNEGLLEYGVINGVHDPKGKKDHIFRKGDLVVSRINMKDGMITIIPDEIDEIRGTGEYYKVVSKKDENGKDVILLKYLYIVLRSEPIKYVLNAISTGQYGRISDDMLGDVEIPVPPIDRQKEVIEKYEEKRMAIQKLEKEMRDNQNEWSKEVETILLN